MYGKQRHSIIVSLFVETHSEYWHLACKLKIQEFTNVNIPSVFHLIICKWLFVRSWKLTSFDYLSGN